MTMIVLGDGGLGRAVVEAARTRGADVQVLGRPRGARHDAAGFSGASVVVDATRGDAVLGNVTTALEGGVRALVIATTGWDGDRPRVDAALRGAGATAVASPNFSLGVALFARLVDAAVDLYGGLEAFDPYVFEQHRRTKPDRPSGTAAMLARRIVARHPGKRRVAGQAGEPPLLDELEVVAVRAGASPGMHLVGFDAPGESIELRLTARDRTAYAAGILAAADWLAAAPRTPGLHSFDPVVDDLLRAAPERVLAGVTVAA